MSVVIVQPRGVVISVLLWRRSRSSRLSSAAVTWRSSRCCATGRSCSISITPSSKSRRRDTPEIRAEIERAGRAEIRRRGALTPPPLAAGGGPVPRGRSDRQRRDRRDHRQVHRQVDPPLPMDRWRLYRAMHQHAAAQLRRGHRRTAGASGAPPITVAPRGLTRTLLLWQPQADAAPAEGGNRWSAYYEHNMTSWLCQARCTRDRPEIGARSAEIVLERAHS